MQNVLDKYEIVIGLEIHAQLQTQSKIFATDANQFGQIANTNISVITLAHPGTLPKINKKVVEYAVRMGLACGCEINKFTYFDRKNYFYPDLPKGFQTSQDKLPICVGGNFKIQLKNQPEKIIRIHHIHLEEDAGKLLHQAHSENSFIDFNRAGTPLIEIVTQPDLSSAEEAATLMQNVRQLVRYLEICDGNLEEGSLRCDANVSVRLKGASKLGTRVEIKNLNSFRFLQKAIDFEANRQIELIEKGLGAQIIQETRTFDPQSGQTYGMRAKENLNDYRYFPEPDLAPMLITEEWIQAIKNEMSPLPWELKEKLIKDYQLSPYDAQVITDQKETAQYFLATANFTPNFKAVANWINGEIKAYLNEKGLEIKDLALEPKALADLVNLVADNKVNKAMASQKLFPALLNNSQKKAEDLAKELNILIETAADDLTQIIQDVLNQYPDKVKEFKKGKKGLQGMFMGEIMKKTKGKADPKITSQLLNEALEKYE
jgi:aspartyl-tRNA(Asn)/glutamyl-tRNA(Gln) amidotransferase subunit B